MSLNLILDITWSDFKCNIKLKDIGKWSHWFRKPVNHHHRNQPSTWPLPQSESLLIKSHLHLFSKLYRAWPRFPHLISDRYNLEVVQWLKVCDMAWFFGIFKDEKQMWKLKTVNYWKAPLPLLTLVQASDSRRDRQQASENDLSISV